MIGTRIATSPATRPFYNRGVAGESIVRTLLGNAYQATTVVTLTISPVTLAATDTLLVASMHNNAFNVDSVAVTINGRYCATDNNTALFGDSPYYQLFIWSLPMNGTPETAQTVTLDFTASSAYPTVATMIAVKVAGLRQSPVPLDAAANAVGLSGTQDSGYTAAVAQAHEYLWGVIGTTGNMTTDVLGTWDASWVAGDRAGGTVADLKEAYWIVNTTPTTYRARLTGATSRRFGATCTTYRAA